MYKNISKFKMEDNLAFSFPVCWGEPNSGVSKDVFLMIQVSVEKEEENILWKALRPKLFLTLLGQGQLKSQCLNPKSC